VSVRLLYVIMVRVFGCLVMLVRSQASKERIEVRSWRRIPAGGFPPS